MRRVTIFLAIAALAAMLVGCGNKAKYKSVYGDLEKVLSDLQNTEKNLGKILTGGAPKETNCKDSAGIANIEKKLSDIRKRLDAIKPSDMPMTSETVQSDINPNTQIPVLETRIIIDWGKVTGDDQKIWANLHTSHTALMAALKTAEVACECAESGDKESLSCQIISIQKDLNGNLSFDLTNIETSYLTPTKELIESKAGK